MKKTKGFTIIELMITLAVAGVLLSIAVPSFTTMIKNNRIVTRTNDLSTALNLARSEAIKRSTTITVEATDGSSWASGWSVKQGATTLRVFPALSSGITLSNSGGTALSYVSTGFVTAATTFTICDDRTGETGRTINIGTTGRIRVSNVPCS